MFSAWRAARIDGLRGPALARSAPQTEWYRKLRSAVDRCKLHAEGAGETPRRRSALGVRDGET